jgi:hypothetical protein
MSIGMQTRERRKDATCSSIELRGQLNPDQRETLNELERFGWRLQFVRQPLFLPSTVVVFDTESRIYGVLEEDGTLNQQPELHLRH